MRLKARHAQKNHCTDCGRYARREDALKMRCAIRKQCITGFCPYTYIPASKIDFYIAQPQVGAGEFQSEYF